MYEELTSISISEVLVPQPTDLGKRMPINPAFIILIVLLASLGNAAFVNVLQALLTFQLPWAAITYAPQLNLIN